MNITMNMRKTIVAVLCAVLAAGCGGNTFKVKGTIAGAKNGTLYLQKEEDGRYVSVDSLEMGKNGQFAFSDDPSEPQMYYLAFGQAAPVLSFFGGEGPVTVEAHIDSLKKAVVKGGPEQELYTQFMEYMQGFADRKEKIYLDILRSSAVDGDKDSIGVYGSRYEQAERRQGQFVANFVVTHPQSRLSPLLAYTFLNKGYSPLLDTIAAGFSPEVAGSKYGKEFIGFVAAAKNTLPGMKAPDFELKKDSTAYNLRSFAGKYLFVVAWAPANQANTDYMSALKQVYQKWHPNGLEVLSSSTGGSEQEYSYDIYMLQMPWSEVRDARGIKNELVEKFAMTGTFPSGVLIDPQGRVSARDITPDQLDKILGAGLKDSDKTK